MVNFYKNMWDKRSAILVPLASMTGKGTKFKWLPAHLQAFEQMKEIMSKEILLAFLDFTKGFTIHIDTNNKETQVLPKYSL